MSFLDPIGRLCRALLRLDSSGTPGPPGGLELQKAHLEQLTVMLQWLDDVERCAVKGWPVPKLFVTGPFDFHVFFDYPSYRGWITLPNSVLPGLVDEGALQRY